MKPAAPKPAGPSPARARRSSKLEARLAGWLDALRPHGLPAYVRELPFAAPDRQFRADFAFPDAWVIIEVDGGTFSGGRHVTGAGYGADVRKANLAHLLGWTVYRVTETMLVAHKGQEPEALELVRRIFGLGPLAAGASPTVRRTRRTTLGGPPHARPQGPAKVARQPVRRPVQPPQGG